MRRIKAVFKRGDHQQSIDKDNFATSPALKDISSSAKTQRLRHESERTVVAQNSPSASWIQYLPSPEPSDVLQSTAESVQQPGPSDIKGHDSSQSNYSDGPNWKQDLNDDLVEKSCVDPALIDKITKEVVQQLRNEAQTQTRKSDEVSVPEALITNSDGLQPSETANVSGTADVWTHHTKRPPEPLESSIRQKRHVRKVTSRGSLISVVASVHSVTSVTYRSPDGNIETENTEQAERISYFPDQDETRVAEVARVPDQAAATGSQLSQSQVAKKYERLRRSYVAYDQRLTDPMSSIITSNEASVEAESSQEVPNKKLIIESTQPPSQQFKQKQKPILFLDAVGRRFAFPWQSCATWQGMEELISSAFAQMEFLGPRVEKGQYELLGPDGKIILPQVWDSIIEPGWKITMNMEPTLNPQLSHKVLQESGTHSWQSLRGKKPTPEESSLDLGSSQEAFGTRNDSEQTFWDQAIHVIPLENGLVRLKWKCHCNHPFQVDVLEFQKGAAAATIRELVHSSNNSQDATRRYRLSSLPKLSEKIASLFRQSRSIEDDLPLPCLKHQKGIGNSAVPRTEAPNGGPDRYICVCFPGITYKKYLDHVDVNKADNDSQLFFALQSKYYDWKPLWRRLLTLRSLARVEYFEFRVFHSNLVAIKDEWRDRFPQGHGPNEWSYTPNSRDMTPYLIDDVLTHYVHSPECVKPGTYFWNRIPKKLFCQLECPSDKPFNVGWGLYFIEDFNQLYLLLILVPVLLGGVTVATWYCARYGKSFADGATVASGFTALVMYMFSVAQGWAKQKGNL